MILISKGLNILGVRFLQQKEIVLLGWSMQGECTRDIFLL